MGAILFIIIVTGISIWVIYLVIHKAQTNQRRQAPPTLKVTHEAPAVLLNFQSAGEQSPGQYEVILQVQVQPFEGRNFVTEAIQILNTEDLMQLRVGSIMHVQYNPAKKKRVYIYSA